MTMISEDECSILLIFYISFTSLLTSLQVNTVFDDCGRELVYLVLTVLETYPRTSVMPSLSFGTYACLFTNASNRAFISDKSDRLITTALLLTFNKGYSSSHASWSSSSLPHNQLLRRLITQIHSYEESLLHRFLSIREAFSVLFQ